MDKRRRSWIAPSILSLLLIAAIIWGYDQYQRKAQFQVALENNYQRLFYDVKTHVEKVQVNLSKALFASTKERNVLLLSQIMSDANSAKDKLGQMPITHSDLANTEKFLTQASDYSYFLIQKHMEGQEITPEQREQLTNIQLNTAQFNTELQGLSDSIGEENFLLGMASRDQGKEVNNETTNNWVTSLANMDQEVAKAPELIYDGPFADQMINRKPVGLSGENISVEQAQKIALEFLGEGNGSGEIVAFEQGENIGDVKLPTYSFQIDRGNGNITYISVSIQGGKVVNTTTPRGVTDKKLSLEEGQKKALEYLQSKGFENMEPNYNLRYDGTVLYNYVYTVDDVTIYPDLIKVKVALDTGEVVGFDAAGYYMNHQERDIYDAEITAEQARASINTNFTIDSVRLSMIPKGKEEILCYEFKGKYKDADFITYINAKTGQEEQILQIIENENGTLTF